MTKNVIINRKKEKNYDHYTGKYRGAAHLIWNLRYKSTNESPVVLHTGITVFTI